MTRSPYQTATTYLLAAVAFLLDQWSKLAVATAIALGHSSPLVDGVLYLTHTRNLGAAWSLFWGHTGPLAAVAVAFAIGIVLYERRQAAHPLMITGLGLLLGGALGNGADRLALGYVRDMIDVHWAGANVFPIFNVADMAVFTGVCCLLAHQALTERRARVPAAARGE
ncbi:MAG: Lipoprotein signal peptidase [Cyanobacteria bacterium RYN_339]|nr:Lipoprotein signal peptidase [Cyanobacteria bacterium RYN_339]